MSRKLNSSQKGYEPSRLCGIIIPQYNWQFRPAKCLGGLAAGFCFEAKLLPKNGCKTAKKSNVAVFQPPPEALERLKQAGIDCGISAQIMKLLVGRLRVRSRPPTGKRRKLDDKQLVDLIDDRLARTLEFMDDFTLAHASARDLAVTSGVLIDKRQLLRDKPTHIVKIEDIRKMDEMAKLLHEEMERRGLLVDVTPEPVADAPAKNANGGRRGGAYRALPG